MAIEVDGMSFDDCDDANIPVDLWLDKDEESGRWHLRAGNYMPRRGHVSEGAYSVYGDTREELAEIVRQRVIPLYRTAIRQLEAICSGEHESLYYWNYKG